MGISFEREFKGKSAAYILLANDSDFTIVSFNEAFDNS
jgi:hypothetical protein